MEHQQIFLSAAASFVDVVTRVPRDGWDGPGLGGWSLRELTGHTVSAGLREVSMPHEVLAEAAALAARVGVEVGDGPAVLMALTGRSALPAGFCVL